jgi:hypothetical protein
MTATEKKIKAELVESFADTSDLLSVIAYEEDERFRSLTDNFDILLLVVTRSDEMNSTLYHYIKENYRIQEYRLTTGLLQKRVICEEDRDFIRWLTKGEVLVDKEAYLEQFRQQLADIPESLMEQKLLIEFTKFLRNYLQSKEYVQENHLLDAHRNLLEALHYWARLTIIENGHYPEVTIWEQVKHINLGVYKLYEELTMSTESLLDRLQLVLLACEFSVVSKMESSCRALLRLLSSRVEPWGIEEIHAELGLTGLPVNLSLLLSKLVKKELIQEVIVPKDEVFSVLDLKYTRKRHGKAG